MANKLEKNPARHPIINYLTMIIVLIVLVCLSLAIAFAFASPSLDTFQKWFLILSITFFAFFSIAVVAWLVMRHSSKLAISENDKVLTWETTSEEKQKRKLNNEVRELAKYLEIPPQQLSDLRSAYIVAEDLALRRIQGDSPSPLMRKITIGNSDFDAVGIDGDLVTFVEATFVVTPDISSEKILSYLRKVEAARKTLDIQRKGSRLRFLLVMVTQLDKDSMDELRPIVRNNIKAAKPKVAFDVRFLDFLILQKIYAED